jgi:hypothetical protein
MSGIFPTHRLFNKNVLITGASGGIGAATGELFGFGRYANRRPYLPPYYRRGSLISFYAFICRLAHDVV